MTTRMKRLIRNLTPIKTLPARIAKISVFSRQQPEIAMNELLAIYFHRMAATTYFLYVLWGAISTVQGVPSLVSANGQAWTTIFSFCLLVCAVPACFGAIFWPLFARLEALAGSSLVAFLLVYHGILLGSVFRGELPPSAFVLLLSILVLPICRTIIVIFFLIKQAELRHRDMALALEDERLREKEKNGPAA